MSRERLERLIDTAPLTAEVVREAVAYISSISGDDEAAHGAEDTLYVAVLTAIARGDENAAALAEEALKADVLEFSRWRA